MLTLQHLFVSRTSIRTQSSISHKRTAYEALDVGDMQHRGPSIDAGEVSRHSSTPGRHTRFSLEATAPPAALQQRTMDPVEEAMHIAISPELKALKLQAGARLSLPAWHKDGCPCVPRWFFQ